MFEGYPFKDISHILTPVSGTLHMRINLTPLNNVSNIGGIIKKLSPRRAEYPIGCVLQPINLYASFEDLL